MEQRLLEAQQKLQQSEKQAVVAELAGATAHELNQPLTAIMGYVGLMERQGPSDTSQLRAIAGILSEAERMASIVKRIGKITRYETTDYVGNQRIVDLKLASPESNPTISVVVDEGQTGEFHAVTAPGASLHTLSPTLSDLRDLSEREGKP
jgi:signal transduction histidine kinase